MSAKHDNEILLVCPVAVREKANAAMVAMLGPGHADTFSAGYSTDGKAITHYVAHGWLTPTQIARVRKFVEAVQKIEIVASGAAVAKECAGLATVSVRRFAPQVELAARKQTPCAESRVAGGP